MEKNNKTTTKQVYPYPVQQLATAWEFLGEMKRIAWDASLKVENAYIDADEKVVQFQARFDVPAWDTRISWASTFPLDEFTAACADVERESFERWITESKATAIEIMQTRLDATTRKYGRA